MIIPQMSALCARHSASCRTFFLCCSFVSLKRSHPSMYTLYLYAFYFPQALSANLCCKHCAPFYGIFLASGSDISQRLYSFSVSKAPTIFSAVCYIFVCFIQRLRLFSWPNEFFLVMTFFCAPSRNNCPHLSHKKRKDPKMILSPTISYKYDSGWPC